MQALGFHYLIELYQCESTLLKDREFLETLLSDTVKESGATEIGRVFHEFSPHGASGVILISESHFSIHTWPEHCYVAIDLFTCNKNVKIDYAYNKLKTALHSQKSSIIEIKRGLEFNSP